jgi:predicted dehydrogenase/nucleoside-diphosphate-sugar epimerase
MDQKPIKEKKGLKVALFGCGKMGMHHLQVIKSLPSSELVGIADPRINEQDFRKIAGPGVMIAPTAEGLLDKVKPDVVHIVTPPYTHYALGKLAIDNDIHVYIEKPFALQEKHAREIIQAALGKGLKVCSGHQLLAHEATRRAEESIPHIGEIVHIESYFSFRKVRRSLSDVDQIIDILPHPVYALLHFLRIGSREANFVLQEIITRNNGEVRAIIGCNGYEGILVVSLRGRPVDSYLRIVGTNGSLHIDYVRGVTINLTGSGFDAIAAITNPYRQGWQMIWKTTRAFIKMAVSKQKSYAGLSELIEQYYNSILGNSEPAVHWKSILDTVRICEKIGSELRAMEKEAESAAKRKLEEEETRLPSSEGKGRILVTGGTGFLGKVITKKLRSAGWPVKVIARHVPSFSEQIPGVEYVAADLSEQLPPEVMHDVSAVIHCAAETSGGKGEHERNSVAGTRNLLEIAASAGIKRFVHISSLAVLKPGRNLGKPLDEASPVDNDNLGRGPYVWGKAKAEEVAVRLCEERGIDLKIVRLGPLVDFQKFEAPGRLGREVGSYFVVMGNRNSKLNICDIHTVAKVVEYYLGNFESAPLILNLVEPDALSRKDLVSRLFEKRKDLKGLYIPTFSINIASSVLKVLQRGVFPSRKPLDIAAAFASERYNTSLAKKIITKASFN